MDTRAAGQRILEAWDRGYKRRRTEDTTGLGQRIQKAWGRGYNWNSPAFKVGFPVMTKSVNIISLFMNCSLFRRVNKVLTKCLFFLGII